MGAPVLCVPTLEVVEDGTLWALIEAEGVHLALLVSRGTAEHVAALADRLCEQQEAPCRDADHLSHLSLTWLMLHEIQHAELNHFDIAGCHCLAETYRAHAFAVARRQSERPEHLAGFTEAELIMVEPCLEMQADHDAIELLLDAYGPEGWDLLRQRAAAVSLMMVLIEREDAKSSPSYSSHPKAATRIFQLLGHITEMPILPARFKAEARRETVIDPDDLPSQEEMQAFQHEVVLPVFHDAVRIAELAGATSIQQDLGNAADFFADVETAKRLGSAGQAQMRTAGGRQWAELVDFNAVLLDRLGLSG